MLIIWLTLIILALLLHEHRLLATLMIVAAILSTPQLIPAAVSVFILLDLYLGHLDKIKIAHIGLLIAFTAIMLNFELLNMLLAGALLTCIYQILRSRYHKMHPSLPDKDLPTVTLAIPARNEDHALTECLLAAVASDYPKLEILVLDDCSQDKTAQIIRSFAHSGVRFVQGSVPPEGWLGKNWACANLIEEASGEYIIFTGVDIRLDRYSARNTIEYMIRNKLDMVSVLPQRRHLDIGSTLLQPIRYIIQLAVPRLKQPAALSSSWCIKSDLVSHDLFAEFKDKIIPEENLALKHRAAYRFLISTKALGYTTRKRINSQIETAVRTIYPSLANSIGLSLVAAIMTFHVFILPFLEILTGSGVYTNPFLIILIHLCILATLRPASWPLALIQPPISGVLFIYCNIKSIYAYLSKTATWKGRNICIPILESGSSEL